MHITHKIGLLALAVTALIGCSNDPDASAYVEPSIQAYAQAGQGDIQGAYVRVSQISATGLVAEDSSGKLIAKRYLTDAAGRANVAAPVAKQHVFELVNNVPNTSSARCQWVMTGCNSVSFGGKVSQTYAWRSVVWSLSAGEHITITPFTELAAGLAENLVYDETSFSWISTGYYGPQGIVQGISQVSKLFGIDNVQTSTPADLTQLHLLNPQALGAADSLRYLGAADSLRYGALLAAWAHLSEGKPNFTQDVLAELLINEGQLYKKAPSAPNPAPTLTLESLYSTAKTNLEAIKLLSTTPVAARDLIATVVTQFDDDINKLSTAAAIIPASLESLLGNAFNTEYSAGLVSAKQFVTAINASASAFFADDYQTQWSAFRTAIKNLSTGNEADLDAIVQQMLDTQQIYRASYLDAGTTCVYASAQPAWVANCSYAAGTGTLTLNNSTITATQANVGSKAQAVDIRMVGEFSSNNLTLTLKPKYINNDPSQTVVDDSRVRVYFDQPATTVINAPVLAYELNWADFTLYASTSNATELKLQGGLNLLFRGVKHPTDDSQPMHFNIDTLRILGDIQDKGGNKNNLNLLARSSNASSFYGADEVGSFASLDKFFAPADASVPANATISDLLSYAQGTETLNTEPVQYFDVRVKGGDSSRYRFYPNRLRNNTDAYGNVISQSISHDLSVCPIAEVAGNWKIKPGAVCSPKQRFLGERDVQKTINDLWKSGVLSYVSIPALGEYFVQWGATQNAQGCFELDPLTAKSYEGTLNGAAVLGIDTLQLVSTIELKDQTSSKLSLLLKKPTTERYDITAALTHAADTLTLRYSTDSALNRNGSISIKRNGVAVGTAPATTVSGELQLGVKQNYSTLPYKYITAADGSQALCVTANTQFTTPTAPTAEPVYSLTFRGVVYGTLRKDGSGDWQATFIDHEVVAMPNFEQLLLLK